MRRACVHHVELSHNQDLDVVRKQKHSLLAFSGGTEQETRHGKAMRIYCDPRVACRCAGASALAYGRDDRYVHKRSSSVDSDETSTMHWNSSSWWCFQLNKLRLTSGIYIPHYEQAFYTSRMFSILFSNLKGSLPRCHPDPGSGLHYGVHQGRRRRKEMNNEEVRATRE